LRVHGAAHANCRRRKNTGGRSLRPAGKNGKLGENCASWAISIMSAVGHRRVMPSPTLNYYYVAKGTERKIRCGSQLNANILAELYSRFVIYQFNILMPLAESQMLSFY